MAKVTVGGIIKTSIVTAFTIATALIWKDVITEAIELMFPADILLLKFIAAILSTIVIVIVVYLILRAQTETEVVWKKIKDAENKNKKMKKVSSPYKDVNKLRKKVRIIK